MASYSNESLTNTSIWFPPSWTYTPLTIILPFSVDAIYSLQHTAEWFKFSVCKMCTIYNKMFESSLLKLSESDSIWTETIWIWNFINAFSSEWTMFKRCIILYNQPMLIDCHFCSYQIEKMFRLAVNNIVTSL